MHITKFAELRMRGVRDPSWPQRLDHNGRRRLFHELRWGEWEPCIQSGQSIKELLERALTQWQSVERIEDRMNILGVGQIEFDVALGYGGGFVEQVSDSKLFKIVLANQLEIGIINPTS